MIPGHPANAAGGASRGDQSAAATPGMARWLSLAAAPTFATMALLIAVIEGGGPDTLCSGHGAWPLGGMVPMYLLMSAFHLAPWLRLISAGHARSAGSDPTSSAQRSRR